MSPESSQSTVSLPSFSVPSGSAIEKPYYPYSRYLKFKFGGRVVKVTVDTGLTCPNIDGTKGYGGCTFCDETGSSSRAQDKRDSITAQIQQNIEKQRRRFKSNRFVAYFQAHTNTYAPLPELKRMFDEAFEAHPDVMGLAISTRPDCVDKDTLELIASYQQPHNDEMDRYISVEYGLQTIHNRTLEAVNRCETVEEFESAYHLTRALGIDHCIHVILGLPGESWEDMMATAEQLAKWRVNGVKIHMLVAMDKTQIAKQFRQGDWEPMDRPTYIKTCCDFLERLHPECVIHRVAGNGHPQHVVAPQWMKEKFDVMAEIDAEFARRGTKQGALCPV